MVAGFARGSTPLWTFPSETRIFCPRDPPVCLAPSFVIDYRHEKHDTAKEKDDAGVRHGADKLASRRSALGSVKKTKNKKGTAA
jgi:hypothetical protein